VVYCVNVSVQPLLHSSLLQCFPLAPTPPQKCPYQWGDLYPHLIYGSLGPSQHPKQHFNWFNCFCTAHGRVTLYFTMGCHIFPKKLPHPLVISTPSNTWFLGPIRVTTSNSILISSAVFAELKNVTNRHTNTDRHTDRPCYSV